MRSTGGSSLPLPLIRLQHNLWSHLILPLDGKLSFSLSLTGPLLCLVLGKVWWLNLYTCHLLSIIPLNSRTALGYVHWYVGRGINGEIFCMVVPIFFEPHLLVTWSLYSILPHSIMFGIQEGNYQISITILLTALHIYQWNISDCSVRIILTPIHTIGIVETGVRRVNNNATNTILEVSHLCSY